MLAVAWAPPLLHTVIVFSGLTLLLAIIYLVITLLTVPWLLFSLIVLWVWHLAERNSGPGR
jgi:4-amino-4-deoxy-L-arabinose transferase-like glycosyltransferase